jgi:hypothetical protein
MSEAGSKEAFREAQAVLMRAPTKLVLAHVELVKAKTAKLKAETFERHGIPADTDEEDEGSSEDDEIPALVRRLDREIRMLGIDLPEKCMCR